MKRYMYMMQDNRLVAMLKVDDLTIGEVERIVKLQKEMGRETWLSDNGIAICKELGCRKVIGDVAGLNAGEVQKFYTCEGCRQERYGRKVEDMVKDVFDMR